MSPKKKSKDLEDFDSIYRQLELADDLNKATSEDSNELYHSIYQKFHFYFSEYNFDERLDDIKEELKEGFSKTKKENPLLTKDNFNDDQELKQHIRHLTSAQKTLDNLSSIPIDDPEYTSEMIYLITMMICIRARHDIIPLISRGIYDKEIKKALEFWNHHKDKAEKEKIWQQELSKRISILNRVLGGSAILLEEQADVGNGGLNRKGVKNTDYLLKHKGTGNAIIVEIKTPHTKILGSKYRNTYPLSKELTGSVSQVLLQYNALMKNFFQKNQESQISFEVHSPKCYIIIGSIHEVKNDPVKQQAFEIQRQALASSVTILTFDELYTQFEQFNVME